MSIYAGEYIRTSWGVIIRSCLPVNKHYWYISASLLIYHLSWSALLHSCRLSHMLLAAMIAIVVLLSLFYVPFLHVCRASSEGLQRVYLAVFRGIFLLTCVFARLAWVAEIALPNSRVNRAQMSRFLSVMLLTYYNKKCVPVFVTVPSMAIAVSVFLRWSHRQNKII